MTAPQFTAAVLISILLLGSVAAVVLGAEASPVAVEALLSGDPRSEGAGPGFVSNPLVILAGVVALGLATVALTILLARLSRRD